MAITLDGTTGIASVDGSAASPSVRGSDSNSGIVYGADTVSISTGGTERLEVDSSGNIDVPDNGKIRLGGSQDLSIYHSTTGNKSYITHSGAGAFDIASTGDNLVLKSSEDIYLMPNDSENGLYVGKNGSVKAYWDNALKWETTTDGTKVTGNLAISGGTGGANTISNGGNNSIDISGSEYVYFRTNNLERARFKTNGSLLVSTTSETINTSNFGNVIGASGIYTSRNVTGASTPFGASGSQGDFYVMGDGDCVNTNNSYGQISDETLKQDIVDAGSQWDDIKNVKVRKFRFKDNASGPLQIGVVAQEIETVSPGLVAEQFKNPKETEGEKVKSVKYSVLYMKAIKALQEAITKIETLETEVNTLKTKVAALEAA